jgi:hypothetical protein
MYGVLKQAKLQERMNDWYAKNMKDERYCGDGDEDSDSDDHGGGERDRSAGELLPGMQYMKL